MDELENLHNSNVSGDDYDTQLADIESDYRLDFEATVDGWLEFSGIYDTPPLNVLLDRFIEVKTGGPLNSNQIIVFMEIRQYQELL
jgi:hypothetical protein